LGFFLHSGRRTLYLGLWDNSVRRNKRETEITRTD